MSVRRSIDSTALKARFREAATARGIDPVAGATGYQVVHLLTERQRVSANPDWWKDHELWDREHDPIRHSHIEEMVIERLWFAAYLCYLESIHVSTQPDDDIPPLRERLAERGEKLVFVETDDGATVSQIALAV